MNLGRLVGFFLVVASMTFSAMSAFGEVPVGAEIRQLTYAGSLCPAGTISPEDKRVGSNLELYFDSFIVEAGNPSIPRQSARKVCSLLIDVKVPAGWTFAIESFKTEATYVNLAKNSSAEVRVMAPIRSGGDISRLIANVRGPKDSDFDLQSPVAKPVVFHSCGVPRAFSMNVEAKVGPNGMLTGDSVDRPVSINFKLVWKKC